MIIYIKDDKIVKVIENEFDKDEWDKYDKRIDTTDFEMADNLDYQDWSVIKLEPIVEEDPFAIPTQED